MKKRVGYKRNSTRFFAGMMAGLLLVLGIPLEANARAINPVEVSENETDIVGNAATDSLLIERDSNSEDSEPGVSCVVIDTEEISTTKNNAQRYNMSEESSSGVFPEGSTGYSTVKSQEELNAIAMQSVTNDKNDDAQINNSDVLHEFYADNEAALDSKNGPRYTVLVLDTSDTSGFYWDGVLFYTADSAVEYVKQATNSFLNSIQKMEDENYVAVVSFQNKAEIISDFTSDFSSLSNRISEIEPSGNIKDIAAGLEAADSLISEIENENAKKNVILISTGHTNGGNYNYSGHYNSNTIASNWVRMDNNINLYAYANHAYSVAEVLKEKATIYSLGLFQTVEDMPERGEDVVEFFKLTAKDLASSVQHYYQVNDPQNINFVFGDIAEDIINTDSDGDGLYDIWEENGIDLDDDGTIDLHIEKMGADVNVPDIFVEVDWMVQPEKKFLSITTQDEISHAPSENAMRMVYDSFKKHGINIHIDAGSESTDFVTGKQWKDVPGGSGGTVIPYIENFNTGTDWDTYVEQYFTPDRRSVFRHSMFINRYDGGTSSGIANDIPGQYFLIANQQWVRDSGDTGVAGTFMHELGHTLGLSHGGINATTLENDHTHYKPNYLSIMNYLFQIPGLAGTGEISYSDYTLPDLNENMLYEMSGVDPYSLTQNTGLGTRLENQKEREIVPIANIGIDFDGFNGVDSNPVQADINADGKFSILTGTEDWSHIIYKAGNVGHRNQVIEIEGIGKNSASTSSELTKEEAVENALLWKDGMGALEALGPYTLPTGKANQSVYVRINNMSYNGNTFSLIVDKSDISDYLLKDVYVAGSVSDISYTEVEIPVVSVLDTGNHIIHASLQYRGKTIDEIDIPVTLTSISDEEIATLLEHKDEIGLSETVINEYNDIYKDERVDETYEIYYDLNGGKASGNPSKYNEASEAIKLNHPTKKNSLFVGWTGSNGNVPQKDVIINTGTKGDLEYIANWSLVYAVNQKEDISSQFTRSYEKYGINSDMKGVATVSAKGVLIGKKAGIATVYGYIKSGNKWLPDTENGIFVSFEKPEISKKTVALTKPEQKYNALDNLTNNELTPTSFTSSKSTVAVIDNSTGEITAKTNGTTKITVIYGEGKSAAKYSFNVKVSIPVISKTNVLMKTGTKLKLTVKNTKSRINWRSSNTNVATVNGGIVSALSAGTTQIIATIDDVDYTSKITVMPPSISKSKITITIGKTASVSLKNTSLKNVRWYSSNNNVATVDNKGRIKGIKAGTATIYTYTGGIENSCIVTVKSKK